MSIVVPTAGLAADFSWGVAVATQLNKDIPCRMLVDVAKTGSSFSDITGLTFTCVNGVSYGIEAILTYSVGGTSTGLSVGYNHPGGTARLMSTIYGNGSATGSTTEWLTATDTATGTSTTDATQVRQIRLFGTYVCTANGTFALRYNRNGTSTTVTIVSGSFMDVKVAA